MRRFIPLLVLAAGCDDTTVPNHAGGGTVTGSGFDAVVQIFDGSCLSCHSAGAATGGLDLETDACASLVDVAAVGYSGTLVVPGDHASSVLWSKMADDGGFGGVMPPGGVIDSASLDIVTAWIDDGASCDGSGDTGGGGGGGDEGPTTTGYDAMLEMFDGYCTGCHSGGAPSGNLTLTGDPCGDLVDATSHMYGPDLLVEPGDHADSVLWNKVADTGAFGDVMPVGNALPSAWADAVAEWIDSGAPCSR